MARADQTGGGAPATAVAVIGMPRSGTSLTTQILGQAGAYLGPGEEMVRPGEWNPTGFWEIRRIEELNRRLLKTLDGDGVAPPPGWAGSDALAGERAEARALLSELFAGRRRWALKITAALPFWQRVASPSHYVICVRNPVDVAASLEGREGVDRTRVLDTWTRHMAATLAYTSGLPRTFVAFDDFRAARRASVERLWRCAGNAGSLGGADAARLEASIEESLLHHRTTAAETVSDPSVPPETKAMYLLVELLRRTGGGAGEHEWAVDTHARRLLALEPGKHAEGGVR